MHHKKKQSPLMSINKAIPPAADVIISSEEMYIMKCLIVMLIRFNSQL